MFMHGTAGSLKGWVERWTRPKSNYPPDELDPSYSILRIMDQVQTPHAPR
jgi:hypothetical protein